MCEDYTQFRLPRTVVVDILSSLRNASAKRLLEDVMRLYTTRDRDSAPGGPIVTIVLTNDCLYIDKFKAAEVLHTLTRR